MLLLVAQEIGCVILGILTGFVLFDQADRENRFKERSRAAVANRNLRAVEFNKKIVNS